MIKKSVCRRGNNMKIGKMLFVLLFCLLCNTIVFAAEMDREQFFDLQNSKNTTRIEIIEKETGNIVNVTKEEEIKKTYEILEKMNFSKMMTYDAYVRENKIGTSNYTLKFYQGDTPSKEIEVTKEKIYNNKWIFFPQEIPNDFYYFIRYLSFINPSYKKTFLEEDFYKNIILFKDNIIIFTKNKPYLNENNQIMAEFKTLNVVLNTNAAYDVFSQKVTINGMENSLYGEQKEGVTYVAVEEFASLLSYDSLWDDTLKILSIQEPKNHNERWEKLRGIPEIYGNLNTVFEDMSLQQFLNMPFTKMTIKNEKTNYTTTISDENDIQQLQEIWNHTTVYQIEKQKNQVDEPIFRYAITLYQDDIPSKTFFMTSENVIKDDVHRISISTEFFDWTYHISEMTYAKALLSHWKI